MGLNKILKPCPFCGNEVYIDKKPLWNGSHGYHGCYEFEIKCHVCGCQISLYDNNTVYYDEKTARENAINAWNRRVDDE